MNNSPTEAAGRVPFSDPFELLYLRAKANEFLNGKVLATAFRFREPKAGEHPSGMSFNRSSMSQPADVLRDYPVATWGVGAVTVADVPPTAGVFSFQVEHAPLPDNAAHSEIRAYDPHGVFVAYPEPTAIRKQYREALSHVSRQIVL